MNRLLAGAGIVLILATASCDLDHPDGGDHIPPTTRTYILPPTTAERIPTWSLPEPAPKVKKVKAKKVPKPPKVAKAKKVKAHFLTPTGAPG